MYVEFWARPDKIFKVHQTFVEDLAFCTTEEAAGKVFLRMACKVPVIWWGHVWSESIRWVGSGISAGRRINTAANFAPFATVSRSEEEKAKDERLDAEAGIDVSKAGRPDPRGYYTGRTYPAYQ